MPLLDLKADSIFSERRRGRRRKPVSKGYPSKLQRIYRRGRGQDRGSHARWGNVRSGALRGFDEAVGTAFRAKMSFPAVAMARVTSCGLRRRFVVHP